jgi:hypothetical protein
MAKAPLAALWRFFGGQSYGRTRRTLTVKGVSVQPPQISRFLADERRRQMAEDAARANRRARGSWLRRRWSAGARRRAEAPEPTTPPIGQPESQVTGEVEQC